MSLISVCVVAQADAPQDTAAAVQAAPEQGLTSRDLTRVVEASTDSQYAFIEQQIFRGEAAEAMRQLETVVSQVEAAFHRYHEDLVVPLTLIGDVHMVQQDYDAALDHYDRARHIARVNYGLFDARQLAVVYRECLHLTELDQ